MPLYLSSSLSWYLIIGVCIKIVLLVNWFMSETTENSSVYTVKFPLSVNIIKVVAANNQKNIVLTDQKPV